MPVSCAASSAQMAIPSAAASAAPVSRATMSSGMWRRRCNATASSALVSACAPARTATDSTRRCSRAAVHHSSKAARSKMGCVTRKLRAGRDLLPRVDEGQFQRPELRVDLGADEQVRGNAVAVSEQLHQLNGVDIERAAASGSGAQRRMVAGEAEDVSHAEQRRAAHVRQQGAAIAVARRHAKHGLDALGGQQRRTGDGGERAIARYDDGVERRRESGSESLERAGVCGGWRKLGYDGRTAGAQRLRQLRTSSRPCHSASLSRRYFCPAGSAPGRLHRPERASHHLIDMSSGRSSNSSLLPPRPISSSSPRT